jgi:hypothetical protein
MLSPGNLPQQFRAVKDDDENFIWVGEPLLVPFLCTGIPLNESLGMVKKKVRE